MSLPRLGRPLRSQFRLRDDAIFLNHGSFGAVPAPVQAAQDAWRDTVERHPDLFYRETAWGALRAAAGRLARFVGAAGEEIVFLPNVTEAVAVVLASLTFQPGDDIVLLDTAYAAVRRAIDITCRTSGAVVRTIPTELAMDNAPWERLLSDALTPRTKLVLLDHIVSPTAQLIPVERLVPIAKAAGARVFIDGAHAVGQLPLDLTALGADWYASNNHKWLFTPRGSCLLRTAPDAQNITRPVVVSHHYEEAYTRRFDYVGTRDVTPYLAAVAGADFFETAGWTAVNAHRAVLMEAADALLSKLGGAPVTPSAPALRAWQLPTSQTIEGEDGRRLMDALWQSDRIQVAANVTQGRLLLRLSMQLYNDVADIERLGDALGRHGWPGR